MITTLAINLQVTIILCFIAQIYIVSQPYVYIALDFIKQMSFNKLKLSNWLLSTCEKIKYHTPTNIQALAIPSILQKQSVIINSQTGSGKTAAFGLPLLNQLSKDPYSIFAVIVAPSLQLAMQIHQQMNIFGQAMNLRQALIVGGVNYRIQHEQLQKYPHIVVGTPGRLAEMIGKSEKFREELARVEVLVLDQADRLFEERLLPCMKAIVGSLPALQQILLATATIDQNFQGRKLQQLLDVKMNFVKHSTFQGKKTVTNLTQSFIFTAQQLKPGYLLSILSAYPNYKTIVFVKTCKQTTLICETLIKLGYQSTQLHSFMKNSQRIANLSMFRGDGAKILITTDLTSRGLDISEVNLVINYNLSRTVADYVHRVGRTARNGLQGQAITFLTPNQVQIFKHIEEEIGVGIDAHQFNEKPNLQLVSKFNRMKREVKIHLMSCGVLDELQKRRQRKLKMRQN